MTKLPCDHYFMGQKFEKGTLFSDCPRAVQKAVIALNKRAKNVKPAKEAKEVEAKEVEAKEVEAKEVEAKEVEASKRSKPEKKGAK